MKNTNEGNGLTPDNPGSQPMQPLQSIDLNALSAEQALTILKQDPIGLIRQMIANEAKTHLASLKEEAELRGAMNLFRKSNKDFRRFEPFIMQEVADLIQNDPDGMVDPWDQLLEKATENFKKKFQEMMLQDGNAATPENAVKPPFMEGSNNHIAPEQPPVFTREQINRMSMEDFVKNESAINETLKNKRIR